MVQVGSFMRRAVVIGAALGCVLACDKLLGTEQAPAEANNGEQAGAEPSKQGSPGSDAVEPASDKPAPDKPASDKPAPTPDAPAPEPDKPAPDKPASDKPAPTPDAPVPAPEPDKPSTAITIESLAASVDRSDDPSAAAWTHYKAKDYAAAIPLFAQATLAEPEPWKHPFNLACAAAMAGNEEAARIGLAAAVARNREEVASKARRDKDLASVRDKPWFEPTLTGADSSSSTEPAAPASSAAPLSAAQLDQLAAQLEAKHGVKPTIRASITQPGQASETIAWAVYGISRMDECLKSSSKKQCTAKLTGDPEDGDFDQTQCAREWLIRASFAAELELAEPEKLDVPCKIGKIREFDGKDVDGDGKAEIVVDVTGRHTAEGMRASEIIAGGREVRILRLDGSEQFELKVAWEVSDMAPGEGRSRTFRFTDENGDGHPDLLIESVEFTGDAAVAFDDAMWVRPDQDEEMVGPVSTKLRHYDPSKDEWGPEISGP